MDHFLVQIVVGRGLDTGPREIIKRWLLTISLDMEYEATIANRFDLSKTAIEVELDAPLAIDEPEMSLKVRYLASRVYKRA